MQDAHEHSAEEDIRINDRKELLELLEELVTGDALDEYSLSSIDVDISLPSTAVDMHIEPVHSPVVKGRACDTAHVGIDPANVEQDTLSMSIEGEIARLIMLFLGDSGICRSCYTVQKFRAEAFPCKTCAQRYCEDCYPEEPRMCPRCNMCLCNDERALQCESCEQTCHDACADMTDKYGFLCCDQCDEQHGLQFSGALNPPFDHEAYYPKHYFRHDYDHDGQWCDLL